MIDADRALALALLRRDWRWRTSAPLLAIAATLAALCTRAGSSSPSAPGESDGTTLALATHVLLPWLGDHLGALAAVGVVLLVLHHLASDATDGWLPTAVAGGAHRTTYLGTVVGSAVALTLAALLAATAAAIGAGAHPAQAARRLPAAFALVTAWATYAAAVTVVARTHGRSLLLVSLAIALPLAITAGSYVWLGTWPPWWATRLLALHLPLITLRDDLAAVSYQMAYTAIVAALLLPLAERRVAREP